MSESKTGETTESAAASDVKYLLTGGTGFIGSKVFCDLAKKVGIENVVLLVRKKPEAGKSLFGRRLVLEGMESQYDKVQFVLAPFGSPDLFNEGLQSLNKSYGSHTKWRVIHMAAVISLMSGDSKEQKRINVGVTEDLLSWSNSNAERFIFTSSIAAFGGTLEPRVRTEKDFADFPNFCRNFPYFTTKREAHVYILDNAKIPVSLICPSIVHGALDSFKDSRPHLDLLRNGKLRLAPRGGSNFVGLDRVVGMIVDHATAEKAVAEKLLPHKTFLCVDRNITIKEYFELYLEIYQGGQKHKIRLLPRFLDTVLVKAHEAFSDYSFWPKFIAKLPQASLFHYFNSEFDQPPTRGLEEALRDSLSTR